MMIIFNFRGLSMTREEAKNLLPIIQAFAEGKTIQYEASDGWIDLDALYPHNEEPNPS